MTTFLKKINHLKNNRDYGSSRLLDKIITIFLEEQYDTEQLKAAFSEMNEIDSSMIIIRHFITSMKKYIDKNFRDHVLLYRNKWQNHPIEVAKQLLKYRPTKQLTILTHSHSGMVQNVIKYLCQIGYSITILQTKSEPGGEGRIQESELLKAGFNVELIDDDAIIQQISECNYCFTGVDQYDSQYFVNKTGTKAIIEYAYNEGIPVFVLGDPRKQVAKAKASKNSLFETIPYRSNVELLTGV